MMFDWDKILLKVLETASQLSSAVAKKAELKKAEIPIRIEERKDAAELTRIAFNNKEAKRLKRSIKNYVKVVDYAAKKGVIIDQEILSGLDLQMQSIENNFIGSLRSIDKPKAKRLFKRIRERKLNKNR